MMNEVESAADRPFARDEMVDRRTRFPLYRFAFPSGERANIDDISDLLLIQLVHGPIPPEAVEVPAELRIADRPQLFVDGPLASLLNSDEQERTAVVGFDRLRLESVMSDVRNLYFPAVPPTNEHDPLIFDLADRQAEGKRRFNLTVRRPAKAELASFFSDELPAGERPVGREFKLTLGNVLSYGELETDWQAAAITLRFETAATAE